MDPLVDNDTRPLHWKLSFHESKRLLAAIFPDPVLFQTSVESPQAVSSSRSPAMFHVLEKLREGNHYGEKENVQEKDAKEKDDAKGKGKVKGKGKGNAKGKDTTTKNPKKTAKKNVSECWLQCPLAVKNEDNMADFLNDIMNAVEDAINGKFLNKQ